MSRLVSLSMLSALVLSGCGTKYEDCGEGLARADDGNCYQYRFTDTGFIDNESGLPSGDGGNSNGGGVTGGGTNGGGATGGGATGGGTMGGGDMGGGDMGGGGGGPLTPCDSTADCDSGQVCVNLGGMSFCVVECEDDSDCPSDFPSCDETPDGAYMICGPDGGGPEPGGGEESPLDG